MQEHAALERLGVAHRGDGDVDAGAGLEERGDVGGDHHGGGVLSLDLGRIDRESVTLENVADGTQRGGRVGVAISGETHDDAVADELVVAPAFDLGEVLHPGRVQRGDGQC